MKNIFKIIQKQISLQSCIKYLDKNVNGIIILINSYRRVLGIVTDGDVRKAILNGLTLNTNFSIFMNRKYIFTKSLDENKYFEILEKNLINHLILLNKDRSFKAVIFNNLNQKKSNLSELTAFILAGGKGTRLYPLTNNSPKPMLKVNDTPILELIINNLHSYGLKDFNISINYLKNIIKNYFKSFKNKNYSINFIEEKKPLGTIGSLSLLNINKIKSNEILVVNGDVITDINYFEFYKFYQKSKSDLCIASKLYSTQIPFGVLKTDKEIILDISEKPEIHNFISAGTYIISKKVQRLISKNKYMDMNDLIRLAIHKKYKTTCFPIHENWADIGTHEQLQSIKKKYV